MRLPILLLALPWLTACTIGPEYRRPDVTVPERFAEAGAQWHIAAPGEPPLVGAWWKPFADASLDALEERVSVDNQNLKVAEAQYRAARASVDAVAAAQLPALSLAADAGRTHSKNVTTGTYGLAASASWEIDLWGRIRKTVEAARASAEASAADLAAARLSTQALLAQTWFQWVNAAGQRQLLLRTLEADRQFLDLTRSRYEAGVASSLDIAQAETQLATAQIQLSESELQQAQLEHALTALLGGAHPNPGEPPASAAIPATPRLVPSALLESRPDIAAAERRVAAANAQIGLARTAYFPSLDLGAGAGWRSTALGQLFDAPSRIWSVGPALALTLFEGGARAAASRKAVAEYDQAVAIYRQTVLTAFQEIEDNLAAARLLQREAEEQTVALTAARRAQYIAEEQYRAGTASALTVITARINAYAAERDALNIHMRRLLAGVMLLKNLASRENPLADRIP